MEPDHSSRRVFEILVREHADMLTAFLRSIVRDSSAVDDLFQETMMVAWRRLGDFDSSRPFAPWLRGIAAKCALASFRGGKHRALCTDPTVLANLDVRFDQTSRLEGDSFRDRVAALASCMDKLPDAMREALTLAYSQGLMLKQIAEITGQLEETIKKRVQRARQSLADCILAGDQPS